MDIKAPFDKSCVVTPTRPWDAHKLRESAAYLMGQDKIPYEFRMTVIPQFTVEDIALAAKQIAGARIFYLQPYVDHGMGLKPPSAAFLEEARAAAEEFVKTEVR